MEKHWHFYSMDKSNSLSRNRNKCGNSRSVCHFWLAHAYLPHCLLQAEESLKKGGEKMSGTGEGHEFESIGERTLASKMSHIPCL